MDTNTFKDIEDRLMAALELDAHERALYYHLARHTRAEGKKAALFSIARLGNRLGMSDSLVRDRIRSLHKKGCIKIEERSKEGHHIRVLLPDEIEGLQNIDVPGDPVDIEAIDFFSDPRMGDVLLKREGARCFYCLRHLHSNWVRDHVVPLVDGGSNSYRNLVACCHECNAVKQTSSAEDFLRALYRRGLLDGLEFDARRVALEQLKTGRLLPEIPDD
ncbi:MAG: HNH endonuclease [Candidatus Binataceae bacterium]